MEGNTVKNKNENLCSIIVLDDGTWARFGKVLTITETAYDRLLDGDRISDLDANDIVESQII